MWVALSCRFEGCERTAEVKGLCKTHRNQERQGKELTPIGSTHYGGKNKSKQTHCAFPNCDRPYSSNGWCHEHDAQLRRTGEQWEIGTGRSRKDPKNMTYTETKQCDRCKKTKNWKSFVLGADTRDTECRDCYRRRILPVDNKKHITTEELLALLP